MSASAPASHPTPHCLCKHLLEWKRTSSTTSTATHLRSEGLRKNFLYASSSKKLTEELVWVNVCKVGTTTTSLVHFRSKHIIVSSLICITETRICCSYFFKSFLSTRRSILVGMHSECKLHCNPDLETVATLKIHLLYGRLFLVNLLLHPFQPLECRKN